MSPRNEVFEAIPIEASYEANEPLIAGGDAEEEDRQLDEKQFSRFKLSTPLLLGSLVGFLIQFSTLGTSLSIITFYGEDLVSKSKTNIVVFSLLWSFFTAAMTINVSGLLCDATLTITYAAVGRRSKGLLEEVAAHMECRFDAGVCLAWTMTGVLLASSFGHHAGTN